MNYFIILQLILIQFVIVNSQFLQAKERHQAQLLANQDLQYLSQLSDKQHWNRMLDNILIQRVVGTETHEKVFRFIVKEMKRLKWHVHIDEFVEENVPIFNRITFKNIVATLNPNAERFLVLACHYDSKYFPNGEIFLGATDSAVPCAMLLNLAHTLANELKTIKTNNQVSLKLVFFDGEEALQEWSSHDSIYGAKHLAKQLETNLTVITSTGELVNDIQRYDLLILLDLIGKKQPTFYSYFPNTQRWYNRLIDIEDKLKQLNLLQQQKRSYFRKDRPRGLIEDDHIPFLIRNVPILHLIPSPFPSEWHTPADNRKIIDEPTVENLNLIIRAFVCEYLHLSLLGAATVSLERPEKEL